MKSSTIPYISKDRIKTTQLTEEEQRECLRYHSINVLLVYQKLSLDFCVNYILNPRFQNTAEEEDTDIYDVLFYQKHISEEELMEAMNKTDY
jgi:hypothetical protein